MKKFFKYYITIWIIGFVLFHAVTFFTPNEMLGMSKFGGAFWIGYVFVLLAFIGQLACAWYALGAEKKERLFLNLPIVTISNTALIVTLVVGAAFMLIPDLPVWLGGIICLIILAAYAAMIIKAAAAGDIVADIDSRVEKQTFFIKSLTADAQMLLNTAGPDSLKTAAKKVYEAIRYSDPMSANELAEIQTQISYKFNDFSAAVNAGDEKSAAEYAIALCALLDNRNQKCKLLK